MIMYIVLGLLLVIIIVLLSMIFKRKEIPDELLNQFERKVNEMFPKLLQNANEQLVLMADQKLGAEKQDIKTDLQNKKTIIEDMVKQIKQAVDETNKKTETAERERVGSFRELKSEMENQRRLTEQLSATTEGLKKVLSNNQLRGQFGEQVADDLLKMVGFVNGVDYDHNKTLSESDTRPDFTILLPDGVKINVDVKFPYANLQKMTETNDGAAKKEHLKAFEKDVKDKIKQITSRNYINPEENTVDFVIMFIPNEMIFSFIYEKMGTIWTEGMRQKVIFAGPFNFTAILRLIRQSYSNFKYQNNVHKIITYIKAFEEEFKKYNEEFDKLGTRITSVSEQYTKVGTTRTRQLMRTVEKIQLEEGNKSLFQSEIIPIVMDDNASGDVVNKI